MLFGDNLKKWRKKRKLTQSQLGESVGVTGAYIQQLELGKKTNPSIEVIVKLCNALKISPYDLDYKFKDNELFYYLTNRDADDLNKNTDDLNKLNSKLSSEIENILSHYDYKDTISVEELDNLLNDFKTYLLNLLDFKFKYYNNMIKLQHDLINDLEKKFGEIANILKKAF